MKLEIRNVSKRFPGILANDQVSLTVESGEIHALLGENGAGKTTLMNILYGLYRADEGEILVDGVPCTIKGPSDAIRINIGMVHQHFMLIPVFTVIENVMLGVEPTRGLAKLDVGLVRNRILAISEAHQMQVDPDSIVENLPVGVQQRVEIIKALYRDCQLLILDEPTAVLTPQETNELFEILKSLKKNGTSIIFITHKLNEVMAVSDRITVMRLGKVVGQRLPGETNVAELAALMVGRSVNLTVEKEPASPGKEALRVENMVVQDHRNHPVVNGVSFQVRSGEIVVIAGVQGNGQTELVEALIGVRKTSSGIVFLNNVPVRQNDPRFLFEAGVSYVPEDRLLDGLVGPFSISDNLILNRYYRPPFATHQILDRRVIAENARELVNQFDVRAPSTDTTVAKLSGGNQQKVIIARELSHLVTLLIASQPTRGLDVGSIEYIHQRIVQIRDQGAAVLIVSTELDEVLALADRILVLYKGQIVGEMSREEATVQKLGLLMGGSLLTESDHE